MLALSARAATDGVPWFKKRDPNAIPAEYQPHLGSSDASSIEAGASPPEITPESGTAIRISGVYRIGGLGVVAVGKVEAGTVRPSMRFHAVAGRGSPTGPLTVEVGGIEMHHQAVTEARTGDIAGFQLRGLPDDSRSGKLLRQGDLLMAAEPSP
jgi:translation elongation factor EF-1alpha